ncbi:universal stress protein [Salinarchaeum sp. IM2453]|uniref:universal stress protein n=1 Tax=Salinarchaeum sp. IM2453 TaxID=2862870 RepID=UPI001C83DE8E|nr:universal stress protein [Salinarchaeum sp. IM2453]QZA87828.1 universal stress protein [Salinarchaeum sp. IM2453]
MDILLGIGGGEDSEIALQQTLQRTKEASDNLTIAIFESNDRSISAIRQEVEEELTKAEIEAEIREIADQPASQLVEMAEKERFDQLVIGGGQRSPMGKISLGSITEFVLLNAQVTVRLER